MRKGADFTNISQHNEPWLSYELYQKAQGKRQGSNNLAVRGRLSNIEHCTATAHLGASAIFDTGR